MPREAPEAFIYLLKENFKEVWNSRDLAQQFGFCQKIWKFVFWIFFNMERFWYNKTLKHWDTQNDNDTVYFPEEAHLFVEVRW